MSKVPALTPKHTTDIEELTRHLTSVFDLLMTALRTLSFEDNFRVFKWEGEIAANSEVRIPHPLKRPPTGRLLVRHSGGSLVDGDERWTDSDVFLKNVSTTSSAQVTVIFYV